MYEGCPPLSQNNQKNISNYNNVIYIGNYNFSSIFNNFKSDFDETTMKDIFNKLVPIQYNSNDTKKKVKYTNNEFLNIYKNDFTKYELYKLLGVCKFDAPFNVFGLYSDKNGGFANNKKAIDEFIKIKGLQNDINKYDYQLDYIIRAVNNWIDQVKLIKNINNKELEDDVRDCLIKILKLGKILTNKILIDKNSSLPYHLGNMPEIEITDKRILDNDTETPYMFDLIAAITNLESDEIPKGGSRVKQKRLTKQKSRTKRRRKTKRRNTRRRPIKKRTV
jgi:hypothetical protein